MTTPPIVTLDDDFIGYLEMLTDKATGGDWEHRLGMIRTMADSDGYVPIAVAPNAPKNWRAQRDLNLDYIAAAKPDTMRDLLDERVSLRRDAERWKMMVTISDEVTIAPDFRKNQAALSAYMGALSDGLYLTAAIDAAIDAAMQAAQ